MILYKLRKKVVKLIGKFFYKSKFVKENYIVDLFIYDDIFPHPISGFRYEEFKVLLYQFKSAKIFSEPLSYPLVKSKITDHKLHIEEFKLKYPLLINKLIVKDTGVNINAKLFYCVFLNNIYANINYLEKFKIPFVFTLYPGGGFEIENSISDQKLKKVLTSSQFRKVIVTQLNTKNYLVKKNLCSINKIEYVFGGVVPQNSLLNRCNNKILYPRKETFDIVFCAAKYMPKGLDKGYDVFIDLANSLVKRYNFVHFHVIGGFDKDDIDVKILKNRITFYGYKKFDDLAKIYSKMDVIVSPNKPFLLGKGSFDGFPLGTIVEAVLNGVVALITDELKQNTIFENETDLIIVESNKESIEMQIVSLIENPEKLKRLSENGKNKFLKVYSNDFQMKPRINIIKDEIEK